MAFVRMRIMRMPFVRLCLMGMVMIMIMVMVIVSMVVVVMMIVHALLFPSAREDQTGRGTLSQHQVRLCHATKRHPSRSVRRSLRQSEQEISRQP